MDEISRISETIYTGMCSIVGIPKNLSIRREVIDIAEIIRKPVEDRIRICRALSGSRREGFSPPLASDVDFIIWQTDHHVIWNLNHADKYNRERCTLILMEYSEDRPGFVKLQLLTPTKHVYIRKSCVRINDGLYISSAKYKDNTISLFKENSIQHGPCSSGRTFDIEHDFALCFACKVWPSIATSFTMRCQFQSWPPSHVLKDIINSGCNVVPIGFKGSPQENCEWRISFSMAEKKLVYSMNHTQFLCYGLLKLFLKEVLTVLDAKGQPLLCSYFMKTILFWVIQKDIVIDWNPSSLLSGFWLCFKFLLSCVYHAYLPNFFITENNMFVCKVFGHSRQLLYERLFGMYKLGIACLLHCHSVRHFFPLVICDRRFLLLYATELDIDWDFFLSIDWLDWLDSSLFNTGHCLLSLHYAIRWLKARSISPWQQVAIRKFISSILKCTVYHLNNACNNVHNKGRLRTMYACLNILRLSEEMGCISDKINRNLILYLVGKNKDAITNLTMIKRILTQPYIIYDLFKDPQRYSCEMGGRALSEKMRRAVAMNIKLCTISIERIKELELELRVTTNPFIYVPPYVMTLMLLLLCYRGNPHKQQEVLYELHTLVHHDEGRYIPERLRDISWQILGICQQVCGDHQGALLSYLNSLRQMPMNTITEATYHRIQDVQHRIM